MRKMRLDKILANSGYGSRKEVKSIIKSGRAIISGKVTTDPSLIVDLDTEILTIDGNKLDYKEFYYLMMNKPRGVISATWDRDTKTVIDILPEFYQSFELFPVGRLDKDTEGLLLLTNDGQLAHKLLSPKKHVPKTYYAHIEGYVGPDDVQIFEKGIRLEDDFTTLPAKLNIIETGEQSRIFVTIYEGKFHQVKRMFEAVDKNVIYLKRVSMGTLQLDEGISLGEARELTLDELSTLMEFYN